MKKKCFYICILLFCVLFCIVASAADVGVEIYVNDAKLDCAVNPFIRNGRTMVPMRSIFEAMQAQVEWAEESQTVTATKGENTIVLQIENSVMLVNGQPQEMDTMPVLEHSTTFIPVRAVAQSLDAQVEWADFNQTVYINSHISYLQALHSAVLKFMKQFTSAENKCLVQGKVLDVVVSDDIVFFTVQNFYDSEDVLAVCLSETSKTDVEKLKAYFKEKYVSVVGKYLGKTKALDNMETTALESISVFDTKAEFEPDELQIPKVEALGQTLVVYKGYGNSKMIDAANKDKYLKNGWTMEPWLLLYHIDGSIMQVKADLASKYKENEGWYDEPPVQIYRTDGRHMYVLESELSEYINDGWTTVSPDLLTVYHIDGKTKQVAEYEVMELLNTKEWFLEPPTKLYDKQGSYKYVPQSEVAKYLNSGWSTVPDYVTVYNTDGSTRVIYQRNVEDYLKLGVWFLEPPVLLYRKNGAMQYVAESEVEKYLGDGWAREPFPDTVYSAKPKWVYITPYGKKWHSDKECAGKNATAVDLDYAREKGYSRCQTCL